jgi:hypothetical protein
LISFILCYFLSTPAFATDRIVVYEGDPAIAVDRVSRATGAPPYTLDPRPLSGLGQSGAPRFVDGPVAAACGGAPTTNAALREDLRKANQLYLRQVWADSAAQASAALDRLPCLQEPLEASVATDLTYLRGLVAQELHETDACVYFLSARRFTPNKAWDPNYNPDGRPGYEACVTQEASAAQTGIAIAPGALAGGTLWVDGRPAEPEEGRLSLRAGRHILQLLSAREAGGGVTTWVLDARADQEPLLIGPAGVQGASLSAEVTGAWLGRLVAEASGGGPAYASVGGAVWELSEGAWRPLSIPVTPDPLKRVALRSGLRSSGLTLAVGGTALTLVAWRQVERASTAPSWENTTILRDHRLADGDAWRAVAWGSGGAAVTGLLLTGSSWAVQSAAPTVSLGPGALSLGWIR